MSIATMQRRHGNGQGIVAVWVGGTLRNEIAAAALGHCTAFPMTAHRPHSRANCRAGLQERQQQAACSYTHTDTGAATTQLSDKTDVPSRDLHPPACSQPDEDCRGATAEAQHTT